MSKDNNTGNSAGSKAINKQVSFDDYIDNYRTEVQDSIGFIGQEMDFFLEIKASILTELAEKYFGDSGKINVLDIGSGIGLVDKLIKGKITNLTGVDVEAGVVEKARHNNPDVKYTLYDGEKLPFADNTFDMSFAINVMHHVKPELWENFSREMYRTLKPGGIAVVFEHNPFNPLTRKVVRDCEFDRDAVLLSHKKVKKLFKEVQFNISDTAYIMFFPFRGKIFRILESRLKWFPLGAQQYVTGIKK